MKTDRKKLLIRAIHCSRLWTAFYRDHREDYEEKLDKFYGVRSSTDMTVPQLSDFLDYMNEKKKFPSMMKAKPGSRSAGPDAIRSSKQMYFINKLRSMIHWDFDDGFGRWCLKRFGWDSPKTDKQCFVCIEGLKGLFENQMDEFYGPDWWEMEHADPEIMRYISRYRKEKKQ